MKKLAVIILSLFIINLSTFAASINKDQAAISLLEQPEKNAKVVANIIVGQPIIPIYSQGDWIKVGDPSNGNVGWISNKALAEHGFPKIYMKTFNTSAKDGNGKQLQIIQYSGSQRINEAQVKNILKNFQEQQVKMQQMFNHLFEQSKTELDAMTKQLQTQLSNATRLNS